MKVDTKKVENSKMKRNGNNKSFLYKVDKLGLPLTSEERRTLERKRFKKGGKHKNNSYLAIKQKNQKLTDNQNTKESTGTIEK